MKRIFHLMPNQDIGGVEIAARSLPTGRHGELEFEPNYLVRNPNSTIEAGEYHGPTISLNNPHAYWHAFWRLLRKPPDLLVASLWRSALVLILLKLARPKQKTILFLHSVHDVHWLDSMPNVLVEAMLSGCTPVATDCPTGPSELLQDGQFGYLVPVNDPAAMANAIKKALDSPIPKQSLDLAVAPFKEEVVLDRHFRLLGLSG